MGLQYLQNTYWYGNAVQQMLLFKTDQRLAPTNLDKIIQKYLLLCLTSYLQCSNLLDSSEHLSSSFAFHKILLKGYLTFVLCIILIYLLREHMLCYLSARRRFTECSLTCLSSSSTLKFLKNQQPSKIYMVTKYWKTT